MGFLLEYLWEYLPHQWTLHLKIFKEKYLHSTNNTPKGEPTFNPTNNTPKGEPTYNPMFSNCDTNKFEMAKYSITGDFEKDKLNGKDFSLDVFADLIDHDAQTFNGTDYPYKAQFKDNNGEKVPIDIKKIITLCADITDLDIPEESPIDSANSKPLEEIDMIT